MRRGARLCIGKPRRGGGVLCYLWATSNQFVENHYFSCIVYRKPKKPKDKEMTLQGAILPLFFLYLLFLPSPVSSAFPQSNWTAQTVQWGLCITNQKWRRSHQQPTCSKHYLQQDHWCITGRSWRHGSGEAGWLMRSFSPSPGDSTSMNHYCIQRAHSSGT